MAITDTTFCNTYQQLPNIDAVILAANEPFYVVYKVWIDEGAVATETTMCHAFGELRDIVKAKLISGDQTPGGGVKKDHCSAFKNFFLNYSCAMPVYTPAALRALKMDPDVAGDSGLVAFRVAVGQYVLGNTLTQDQFDLLNGALFVRVQLVSIGASDGGKAQRIYAIPGSVVSRWNFNPDDAVWDVLDSKITQAFASSDSKLINVSGAVQLRLGHADFPFYRPIVIGGGMTTKGSRG